MSSFDEEIKPIGRTNSGSVILFDPSSKTISTSKLKGLHGEFRRLCGVRSPNSSVDGRRVKLGRAPNFGNRVKIYAPDNSSMLVASLKLDKLGWQDSWKRVFGRCNDIYTADLTEERNSVAASAA